MYIQKIIVRGKGVFPIDMLRYDACFPSDQITANQIHMSSIMDFNEEREYCLSKVTLRKGEFGYTEKRWNSFGFTIVIHNTKKVEV